MLKQFLKGIIDYIMPFRCSLCVELIEGEQGICGSCFAKLNFITEPYCSCCGYPFEFSIEGKVLCGACAIKKPHYDIARSLLKFDKESKKLIHAFKYNDRSEHSKIFAKLLISKYKKEIEDIDLVVPVPMHRIKRIFRQYNPAQILAKDISLILKKNMMADALIKTKWTKPQTKLSKSERGKNLLDSLIFNKNRNVAGKNLLLIDDVKTTGTTSNNCAQILKEAGAASVKLLTIGIT